MSIDGQNLSILWSPLNIWTPRNFTIANFGHPGSKSWLRPCCTILAYGSDLQIMVCNLINGDSAILTQYTVVGMMKDLSQEKAPYCNLYGKTIFGTIYTISIAPHSFL